MLASRSMVATIPPRSRRNPAIWYDPERYGTRHLVENYFADLKQFRGVATRYCKLGDSYHVFVFLASWLIETRGTKKTPIYSATIPAPLADSQMPLTAA